MQAVGFIETRGLTAATEALDAMCKAANVKLLDFKRVGSGLVTVIVEGDVAAVQAAVQAGLAAYAQAGGELVASHVIPRPHPGLAAMLLQP